MSKSVPVAQWRTYLRWHLAKSMSPYLSQKFVDEWFHFQQVLNGTKTLQPRWKRCVKLIDRTMGEALAQPFVKQYLGEDGKQMAEHLVAGSSPIDTPPQHGRTLATGASGSDRPVSEAHPRDTLAEGRPGSKHPISERRR